MRLKTENTMLKASVNEQTSRATSIEDILKIVKVTIDKVLFSSPGAPKDAHTTAIVEVEPSAEKAMLQAKTDL